MNNKQLKILQTKCKLIINNRNEYQKTNLKKKINHEETYSFIPTISNMSKSMANDKNKDKPTDMHEKSKLFLEQKEDKIKNLLKEKEKQEISFSFAPQISNTSKIIANDKNKKLYDDKTSDMYKKSKLFLEQKEHKIKNLLKEKEKQELEMLEKE